MQEDLLHYIWQFKKFASDELYTSSGEAIKIISVGQHNTNSGPDFFNAQLEISNQLWAGNVEIHIKSSDWYAHHHERDPAYDNVILHVVYEYDSEIYRKDNSPIPTLELKDYVPQRLLHNYQKLFSYGSKWIRCEDDFSNVDDFIIHHWLEKLYIQRLERKARDIEQLLLSSKNDWEAVLFKLLAKNFGLKVNGDAFFSMANSFDFKIVRKLQADGLQLEALFLGQSALLESQIEDGYYKHLQLAYRYLQQKYTINALHTIPVQFFRLRPPNFPTIRCAQLAMLYHQEPHLFSKVMQAQTLDEIYDVFNVGTSDYWLTHYNFGKESKSVTKKLSKDFIDLLVINTLLPFKFCHSKAHGGGMEGAVFGIIQSIAAEKNSVVDKFNALKPTAASAMQSQALIQLKTNYCDVDACLRCEIGNSLISK